MYPIEHFCCLNSECPDAEARGQGNLSFRGWSGKGKRLRMVYCHTCGAHFSERKGTVLEDCRLAPEKALSMLECLREGRGIRATSRLTGVDKNTVGYYAHLAESQEQALYDELIGWRKSRQNG